MLTIGSLFSGIGGLELGLEWAGLGPVLWQVEKETFCRQVLAKHWPSVERFEDVCEVGAAQLAPVDLICGGFPCQDISSAGKGAGLAGERSGLWREFARIVDELRPRWVVVENVASGARRWVDAVCGELGQLGYETLPVPLSAEDVGAPYRRARVFIVANTDVNREPVQPVDAEVGGPSATGRVPGAHGAASDIDRKRVQARHRKEQRQKAGGGESGGSAWDPCLMPLPVVDRLVPGVPNRVDRIAGGGNCVVPQCAEVIGWVVRELMP